MSAKSDAEKILSGKKSLQVGRALALVRMLEQEAAAGDVDSAGIKTRLINMLLRDVESGLSVSLLQDSAPTLQIRTGDYGIPCIIPTDHLEPDTLPILQLRYGVDVRLDGDNVAGLVVIPPDASTKKLCRDLDASGCVAKARQCIAEYDYDTAVDILRLAVIKSRGALPMVEALAEFLVDHYAYYDEALALLRSPRVATLTGSVLQRCLADALYHTHQWMEAEPIYRQLITKKDDMLPTWMLRLAQICLENGNPAEALSFAQKCQQYSSIGKQAQDVIDRARARLETELAIVVNKARLAVEEGRLGDAKELAERLATMVVAGSDVSALLQSIRDLENKQLQEEILTEATQALQAGHQTHALLAFRRVLERAPDHAYALEQVRRLEAEELDEQARRSLKNAADMESERRVSGAIQELFRVAQRPGGATRLNELDDGRSSLVSVLVSYMEWGPKNPEKSLESLIRLRDAESAFNSGDMERAVMLAEEALRGLKGYPVAEQLLDKVRKARSAHIAAMADEAYKAGVNAESTKDFGTALRRYEEVIRLVGESFSDVAERRHRIKREMDFDSRIAELTAKVEQRLGAGHLFVAQQLIRQTSPDLAEARPVYELEARIRKTIDEAYPMVGLQRTSPPMLRGDAAVFHSHWFGLNDIVARDVRILLDGLTGNLVLLTKGMLILLSGTDLLVHCAIKLPDAVGGNAQDEAVFAVPGPDGSMKIFIFHTVSRTAWVIRVVRDHACVETRLDFSRAITPMPTEGQGTRSAAVVSGENTLVLLDFNQSSGGRRDSRLVVIGLEDGRPLASESFAYGHMHLIPVYGSNYLLAARCFDPVLRQHKSWYHALILDGRGKVIERWNIEGLDEEIYAFRQAFSSPVTGRSYLEYWYLDPLSGRVANDGGAFMILGKDKRLFYQALTPEILLGSGRTISGGLQVVPGDDERDYLLWVWRDEDKNTGVAVIDGKDVRTIGHTVYGRDVHIGAIRSDLSRKRAYCAIFANDRSGFRIEPFHYSSAQ